MCFTTMMEPTGQTYMDLTSKFVASSNSGNNYILIVYDYTAMASWLPPSKPDAPMTF